ncbi:glycosyltransferase family 4 protein [Alteromonas sp. BMJM2]|uniref:glycosyltransferase family 4 protein n=1 Tax=Alteromonas sp. BMJM2 TaxID=2954241 RepID=UPI0022B4D0E2|nr:glycosyltransferase family 4 protein [Alteromonas sp. BMJM2]
MTAKHNVLIIAEAANPEWVSVPLVGWSISNAIRQKHNVHIVTQIRNKAAFIRAGLVEGKDFTAIDSEKVAAKVYKILKLLTKGKGVAWTLATALTSLISYPYFEKLVWKQFGELIKAGHYDIVHRVTPLSPTAQSKISKKCRKYKVPFVMGPLNGGVPWPKGFDGERRREREWLSYVRSVYKLLPSRNSTIKNSSCIIVGSLHTKSEIPTKYQNKVIYIPENGVDSKRFNRNAQLEINSPIKCCFIGRLVPYKCPDVLLIAASPLIKEGLITLDIIGDGPIRNELEAISRELEISAGVTFHGWLEHQEVANTAQRSNLLTFPSIREFGGGVVLEAMALGLVPVVIDYAGPGELVKADTGYKVPIGTKGELIDSYRQMLINIASSPSEILEKSVNGKAQIDAKYLWERKAEQVTEIYDWILRSKTKKPTFF